MGQLLKLCYNGHIRVIYLTIHELPFTRVQPEWGRREKNFFIQKKEKNILYFICFISIQLDKIKPNLKTKENTFFIKLPSPGLEPLAPLISVCTSTTTPYFLLERVQNFTNLNFKNNFVLESWNCCEQFLLKL